VIMPFIGCAPSSTHGKRTALKVYGQLTSVRTLFLLTSTGIAFVLIDKGYVIDISHSFCFRLSHLCAFGWTRSIEGIRNDIISHKVLSISSGRI
jgi:hypothetical protein